MIENNYFAIALEDRKWFKASLEWDGGYNRQVLDCEQISEKYMKGVIEQIDIDFREKADLLKTHNLKRLGLVINNNLGTKLNLESLAYLKDFYFEARYPGDEFISVTKEMRDRCEEIMEDVLQILSPFAGAYKVDMR